MAIVGGVVLLLVGLYLFVLGHRALKNSANHAEYGVATEGRHKRFCWIFMIAGTVCACLGWWLIL